MENFKKVRLRLSVDCVEKAGEYFRFGLKWSEWVENLKTFRQILMYLFNGRVVMSACFIWLIRMIY